MEILRRPNRLIARWNLTAAALVGFSGLWLAISARRGTISEDWAGVAVGLYFVALGIVAAPDIWRRIYTDTIIRRRQLRIFAGACPECGYSLYASTERCPECGTPISAEAMAVMTSVHRLRFRPDISEGAKNALSVAQAEAVRMHHNTLGTEHLLLGILVSSEHSGESLCLKTAIDSRTLQDWIEELGNRGDLEVPIHLLQPTPAARRALDQAFVLQRSEGIAAMQLRHLLEALRAEPDCAAVQLLTAMESTPRSD